jgi:hypothetical protein
MHFTLLQITPDSPPPRSKYPSFSFSSSFWLIGLAISNGHCFGIKHYFYQLDQAIDQLASLLWYIHHDRLLAGSSRRSSPDYTRHIGAWPTKISNDN